MLYITAYLSILHICEVLVLARPLHSLWISASQRGHEASRGLWKRYTEALRNILNDMKHNLKKTVVYPRSLQRWLLWCDHFTDLIISHYHVFNGWVNRERGWPLGELLGCQALRHAFLIDSLHDLEWVPEQSLWPLTFSIHKMWITLVIPFGHQFPLGK